MANEDRSKNVPNEQLLTQLEERQRNSVAKDPNDWVTGEETMTGAQASDLKRLCQVAGVEFGELLTKAEASKLIEELQKFTCCGRDH